MGRDWWEAGAGLCAEVALINGWKKPQHCFRPQCGPAKAASAAEQAHNSSGSRQQKPTWLTSSCSMSWCSRRSWCTSPRTCTRQQQQATGMQWSQQRVGPGMGRQTGKHATALRMQASSRPAHAHTGFLPPPTLRMLMITPLPPWVLPPGMPAHPAAAMAASAPLLFEGPGRRVMMPADGSGVVCSALCPAQGEAGPTPVIHSRRQNEQPLNRVQHIASQHASPRGSPSTS